jgi:hypothetical protein
MRSLVPKLCLGGRDEAGFQYTIPLTFETTRVELELLVPVFHEVSPRQKSIAAVRWLLLLPAAWLASIAAQVVGAFLHALRGSAGTPSSSSIGFWASAVLAYCLPELVFVIAGGWIAPRKKLPVALLLTLLGGVLSLLNHIVLQHLAGRSLGPTNYTHFGLEMAGLLAGVGCIWRLRVSSMTGHGPRNNGATQTNEGVG